jgi:6-phosphogluconolactonase
VTHELQVLPDAEAAAARAADLIAERARAAARAAPPFTLAVSGGRSPGPMFERLAADADLPWGDIEIWQVDERVAPAEDPARNLTGLVAGLAAVEEPHLHPMPVEHGDLDAAADAYARGLPWVFDLVHLGLGADGHTASLVPGDPVLEVTDHDVAVTGPYDGRRRMTLTFPVLGRARGIVWLVTGADKADALRRLVAHDPSIPAGRVSGPPQVVIADRAAAGGR